VSAALLLAGALAVAPASYGVARTVADRAALLGPTEEAWAKAERIAWGPEAYETAFRALWDGEGVYVRFDARDPDPWSTMTKRDEHLWEEEVVEIFLDLDRSGRNYAEVEISPGNVICDVRMISAFPNKEGDFAWDLQGLESRVHLRRDAEGRTTGWTAAAFFPWSGFRDLPSAKGTRLPPAPGDKWRFNVFRVERPGGTKAPDQGALEVAWSKPPGESFHVPEVFRDFVYR
jgi:cellulose/xylan binding protein with CBM9 domain